MYNRLHIFTGILYTLHYIHVSGILEQEPTTTVHIILPIQYLHLLPARKVAIIVLPASQHVPADIVYQLTHIMVNVSRSLT